MQSGIIQQGLMDRRAAHERQQRESRGQYEQESMMVSREYHVLDTRKMELEQGGRSHERGPRVGYLCSR